MSEIYCPNRCEHNQKKDNGLCELEMIILDQSNKDAFESENKIKCRFYFPVQVNNNE
jgi:hypothetical protein